MQFVKVKRKLRERWKALAGWLQLSTSCKEIVSSNTKEHIKGTLSGLRQFLTHESPLKMMKNAFYFTLKALFNLKIFKFLS